MISFFLPRSLTTVLGPLVKWCHREGLLGLQHPVCCGGMVLGALLHPLLCQLKGKIIPAARGHPHFLTAATKLQESTADGISLLAGEGGKAGLATADSAPCPPLLGV